METSVSLKLHYQIENCNSQLILWKNWMRSWESRLNYPWPTTLRQMAKQKDSIRRSNSTYECLLAIAKMIGQNGLHVQSLPITTRFTWQLMYSLSMPTMVIIQKWVSNSNLHSPTSSSGVWVDSKIPSGFRLDSAWNLLRLQNSERNPLGLHSDSAQILLRLRNSEQNPLIYLIRIH